MKKKTSMLFTLGAVFLLLGLITVASCQNRTPDSLEQTASTESIVEPKELESEPASEAETSITDPEMETGTTQAVDLSNPEEPMSISTFLATLEKDNDYSLGIWLTPECAKNIQQQLKVSDNNAFSAYPYYIYMDEDRQVFIEYQNHIYLTNYYCFDRPIEATASPKEEIRSDISDSLDESPRYWLLPSVSISYETDLYQALVAADCKIVDSLKWYVDTDWFYGKIDALSPSFIETYDTRTSRYSIYYSFDNNSVCLEDDYLVSYSFGEEVFRYLFPYTKSIWEVSENYIIFTTTYGYDGCINLKTGDFLFSDSEMYGDGNCKVLYATYKADGLLYCSIKDLSTGKTYTNVSSQGFLSFGCDGDLFYNRLPNGECKVYAVDWNRNKLELVSD